MSTIREHEADSGHRGRGVASAAAGRAAALAAIFFLCACATTGPTARMPVLGSEHPLNGRIYDTSSGRYLTEPELETQLAAARIVLLGEQHDNPEHHELQARVLRWLVKRGKRPVVAFEMITEDRSESVAACIERRRCSPARLAEAAQWNQSGWPDWRIYRPVFDLIDDDRLIPVAAGIPKPAVQALVTGKPAEERNRWTAELGLGEPVSQATLSAIGEEIREAHCGHAPASMLDGMILAQRARDAYMARTVEAAATGTCTVLLAGAGHVRTDRGVPAYVKDFPNADSGPVLSLAFFEVRPDAERPNDYGDGDSGSLPYDYVWFTRRVDDEDPCEKFRTQLERMKADVEEVDQ